MSVVIGRPDAERMLQRDVTPVKLHCVRCRSSGIPAEAMIATDWWNGDTPGAQTGAHKRRCGDTNCAFRSLCRDAD